MQVRELNSSDIASILSLYQRCFAGYPWFEKLSEQTVVSRWQNDSTQQGFECIVMEHDDKILGAIWWNIINSTRLLNERGEKLVNFVGTNFPNVPMIWEREVMTCPENHRKGIATILRNEFIRRIQLLPVPRLILTRMRDDNVGIIKIGEKIGFKRTGIRMPCTLKPEVCHEYWYLLTE